MAKNIVAAMLVFASVLVSSCAFEEESPPAPVREDEPAEQPASKEAVYLLPQEEHSSVLPMEYRSIKLNYISENKAAELMSKMFPDAVFCGSGKGSGLLVKARGTDIPRISDLLSRVDISPSQVMIEAKMVEVSEDELKNLGFTWGLPSSSVKLQIKQGAGYGVQDIDVLLTAMMARGKAKLIASPKVMAKENTEASIVIGKKIPYAIPVSAASGVPQWTVQYIDAGVSLKMTPRVCGSGMVDITIRPEVSSVSEWRATAAGEFPVISTRNSEVSVAVRDGQPIVIAGLMSEADRENVQKLPVAGDIPIIKELFTRRSSENSRSEVVFMITPKII